MPSNKLPKKPTKEVVNKYLSIWRTSDDLEKYRLQEKSLNLLFGKLCADNKTVENILLKVSALNDFYSTNIFDTYSVAKHILGLKIDKELGSRDVNLVNKIALIKVGGKERRFYAFASKYCAHHKPDRYPIYDSYVNKMLWHFRKEDNFSDFNKEDLKDYRLFVKANNQFRGYYNLTNFSLRETDIYLWLAGKKYFPSSMIKKLKRNKV